MSLSYASGGNPSSKASPCPRSAAHALPWTHSRTLQSATAQRGIAPGARHPLTESLNRVLVATSETHSSTSSNTRDRTTNADCTDHVLHGSSGWSTHGNGHAHGSGDNSSNININDSTTSTSSSRSRDSYTITNDVVHLHDDGIGPSSDSSSRNNSSISYTLPTGSISSRRSSSSGSSSHSTSGSNNPPPNGSSRLLDSRGGGSSLLTRSSGYKFPTNSSSSNKNPHIDSSSSNSSSSSSNAHPTDSSSSSSNSSCRYVSPPDRIISSSSSSSSRYIPPPDSSSRSGYKPPPDSDSSSSSRYTLPHDSRSRRSRSRHIPHHVISCSGDLVQEIYDSPYLSFKIKNCNTWRQLSNVFDTCRPQLNHIHLVAMMMSLAKTAPSCKPFDSERREFEGLAIAVLLDTYSHLPRFGSREVSSIMWAVAKARLPLLATTPRNSPPPPVHASTSARAEHRHSTTGAAAAGSSRNTTGAAAGGSGAFWLMGPMECVEALSRRALELLPSFNGQDISMTLWSVARIVEGAETVSDRQYGDVDGRGGMTPAGAGTQMGDGGGKIRPGMPVHLKALVQGIVQQQSKGQLGLLGAQSLSNSLWALAFLRIRPDNDWLASAVERSIQLMPTSPPQVLSNTAWALVVFDYPPPASWVQPFMMYSQLSMAHASPQALSQMAWALARFRLYPNPSWFQALLTTMTARIRYFNPQDLSTMMWALATLRYSPSSSEMAVLLGATNRLLSEFKPVDASLVLWSLASLGYVPDPSTIRRLLECVAWCMSACTIQGLVNTLWALAKMKTTPSTKWLEECVAIASTKLEECGPQDIANLWWALAKLDFCPARGYVRDELADEVLQQLPYFEAREHAMVLWAMATLQLLPQKELLDRHLRLLCHQCELDQQRGVILEAAKRERMHSHPTPSQGNGSVPANWTAPPSPNAASASGTTQPPSNTASASWTTQALPNTATDRHAQSSAISIATAQHAQASAISKGAGSMSSRGSVLLSGQDSSGTSPSAAAAQWVGLPVGGNVVAQPHLSLPQQPQGPQGPLGPQGQLAPPPPGHLASCSPTPRTVSTILWALLELGHLRNPREHFISSLWYHRRVWQLLNCTLHAEYPSGQLSCSGTTSARTGQSGVSLAGSSSSGASVGDASSSIDASSACSRSSNSSSGNKSAAAVATAAINASSPTSSSSNSNRSAAGSSPTSSSSSDGGARTASSNTNRAPTTSSNTNTAAPTSDYSGSSGTELDATEEHGSMRPPKAKDPQKLLYRPAFVVRWNMGDLTGALMSLTRLGMQPPRPWAQAAMMAVCQSAAEMEFRDMVGVLTAITRFAAPAPRLQLRGPQKGTLWYVRVVKQMTSASRQALKRAASRGGSASEREGAQLRAAEHVLARAIPHQLAPHVQPRVIMPRRVFYPDQAQLTRLLWRVQTMSAGLSMRQLALLMRSLAELDEVRHLAEARQTGKPAWQQRHMHLDYPEVFTALMERALDLATGPEASKGAAPEASRGTAPEVSRESGDKGGGWGGGWQVGANSGRPTSTEPSRPLLHPADVATFLTAIGRMRLRPPERSFLLLVSGPDCVKGGAGSGAGAGSSSSVDARRRAWESGLQRFSEHELARCICAFERITSSSVSVTFKARQSNPSFMPKHSSVSDAGWEWLLAACRRLQDVASGVDRDPILWADTSPSHNDTPPRHDMAPTSRADSPDSVTSRAAAHASSAPTRHANLQYSATAQAAAHAPTGAAAHGVADNRPASMERREQGSSRGWERTSKLRQYAHLVDAALRRIVQQEAWVALQARRGSQKGRRVVRQARQVLELKETRAFLKELQHLKQLSGRRATWLAITRSLTQKARRANAKR